MSHFRFFVVSIITVMLLPIPSSVSAQGQSCAVYSDTLCITNGFFDVFVQSTDSNIGTYNIRTGANHPATLSTGDPQSVLYYGFTGSPGSGFTTIRSYTSHMDYINDGGHSVDWNVWDLDYLDAYSTGTTYIGNNGIQTTWVLPGPPVTPDKLKIVQKIEVFGDSLTNSSIKISTFVTNLSTNPVDLGLRYFWDLQIGNDDGPIFSQINPDGSILTKEKEFILVLCHTCFDR